MFVINNLTIFKRLVGKELLAISTSYGRLYSDSLIGDKIDGTLHFKDFNFQFFCNYDCGCFFENKGGDVFYDFEIFITKGEPKYEHYKILEGYEIEKIEIFSRKLNKKDFNDYPKVLDIIGLNNRAEDLFIFYFKDKPKMVLTFHPFMLGLEALFEYPSIHRFFDEYNDLYLLQQEIK